MRPFLPAPLLLCAALAAAVLAVGCGDDRSAPVVWPAFDAGSAANAYSNVAGLVEFTPRDAGTEGAAYASQWIAQRLRDAGLKPRADVWRERSGPRSSVQFCNVYADLPGETNTLLIVGSHFDTKSGIGPAFQGANDGGSSTGISLEVARVLAASGIRPKHTIRFAFFDGEECFANYAPDDGLHGSRRMAEKAAENRASQDVAAVVVLDMVGDADLQLQLPRNATPWIASIVLEASSALDARLGGNSGALVRIADKYILDDHWPFIEQNIPAIDIIDFDYGSRPGSHDYWHTEEDTFDKISESSLGVVGQLLIDILERLDRRDESGEARR